MINFDASIKSLGVLVFDDFELLDVFGPLEMFGSLQDKLKVMIISEQTSFVRSHQRVSIQVDFNLENAPKVDLLLIPGGLGTRKEVNNERLLEWIKDRAYKAEMILSVCTGAALLAKAGILDNKHATTNKLAFSWVKQHGPLVNWIEKARWVEDGNIITSSGVAAGIDMSLFVISLLYGHEVTEHLINTTEYFWNSDPEFDPFSKNIKL